MSDGQQHMQNELMEQAPGEMDRSVRRDDLILLAIAAAVAVVHMATNGRYGFHRDELQTLSDALHMDWGFVAYPPFTPLVERLGLALFGPSLVGLRIFSVAAQSAAIFITGLMAREFGGGGLAQATRQFPWRWRPCLCSKAQSFNTRHLIIYGGC